MQCRALPSPTGAVPGLYREIRGRTGAHGALPLFQTKYTLIDEQDIPLVESYSFEVRARPALPRRGFTGALPGLWLPLELRLFPFLQPCACNSPDQKEK